MYKRLITASMMREAAQSIRSERQYFVCFAVEQAYMQATGSDVVWSDHPMRQELDVLLRHDGISTNGEWFIGDDANPSHVPVGPERQEIRAVWCEKIAAELEALE